MMFQVNAKLFVFTVSSIVWDGSCLSLFHASLILVERDPAVQYWHTKNSVENSNLANSLLDE